MTTKESNRVKRGYLVTLLLISTHSFSHAAEFAGPTDAKAQKTFAEAQEKVKELQDKMYNPVAIDQYEEEVNKHFQQLFPDTKIEIGDSDKVKWTEDKFGKKFNVEFKKQNEDGSSDEMTGSISTSFFTRSGRALAAPSATEPPRDQPTK